MREMEGHAVQEEHVAVTIAAEDPAPPPPPRPRPFSKARPRKELLAQIQRAQEMRHLEQQENIPPVEAVEEQPDKRTTFDKFVDQLDEEGRVPKTSHPRSALEALLNEEGREYNDSTIASLENIIHPVMDTPPQPAENGDLAADEVTPAPARRHRSVETGQDEVLASLSKQLYTTQSTIKDANRGLRRISNKIEGASPSKAQLEPKVERPPADVKIEPPVEVVPKPKTLPKPETAAKKTEEREPEKRTNPKIAPAPQNPPAVTAVKQKTTSHTAASTRIVDASKLDHNGKTPYTKPYWKFLGWMIDTIFNLENGEVPYRPRSVPAHTFTAAAATARATQRVFRSAVDAVDEMGSMWNDELI
ncbi:hypothetical protein PRZ48_015245 [Zasmidium cellare]|uniref:Uncharacterized protein n=1 Tax=Zasmidium cellare TaxID=395010 RepID=A0ABR0DY01_ZASCE|nr:hypothetical protein PRZ48_015245 [Zasmidium cellare]